MVCVQCADARDCAVGWADVDNVIRTDLVPLRRPVARQGTQRQTKEQTADRGEDT
jgi:hypothetical protein